MRQSLSGPVLVDRSERQRYYVAAVPTPGGEICLCTDDAGANLAIGALDPDEDILAYATYVVPPTTPAVTFQLTSNAKLPDLAIER